MLLFVGCRIIGCFMSESYIVKVTRECWFERWSRELRCCKDMTVEDFGVKSDLESLPLEGDF